VKLSLVPRETRFFDLFRKEAALVSKTLDELSASLSEGTSRHERLRELEHECDDIARDIYNLTNLTFATPMAPEDILQLASSLDDIVDLAEEVSDKIDLYHAAPIPVAAVRMGECLSRVGHQLEKAVQYIEDAAQLAPVLQEVHRIENEGDRMSREALQQLFDENHREPADVIKWKDLYDLLERTIDECEAAAEIIETLAVKNA